MLAAVAESERSDDGISDSPELWIKYHSLGFTNVKLVKALHPRNADTLIDVTVSGMITLVKLEQPAKADDPIEISGPLIVTLAKLVQL